jgi:predicted Zn-dependent protease
VLPVTLDELRAELALELGDTDRAIRNLQMVELRDVTYAEACRMLARIFSERGEADGSSACGL